MPLTREATDLPDVWLFRPDVFEDERGLFMETFHEERYRQLGLTCRFVQDNYSHSRRGVLRGLHYQAQRAQAKLVSVIWGEIFDVAVDLRRDSPTFGRWTGRVLSEENRCQLFIPAGFAHGFCVLSDAADVAYKCSDYYDPASERGVRWSDPRIGIVWPLSQPILSRKDAALPLLDEVLSSDLPC